MPLRSQHSMPRGAMWARGRRWPNSIPLTGTATGKREGFTLASSRDTFVFSPNRLTVGIGLTDLVVVDTPDALLIANRNDTRTFA